MADLERIIKVLQENNGEEKAIGTFIENLNNLLAQKIQVELASVLDSDEEMSRLDKLPEDQMQGELAALYKEKTGKDIAVVSQEILDGFVTGFLTQYHKQKLEEQKS